MSTAAEREIQSQERLDYSDLPLSRTDEPISDYNSANNVPPPFRESLRPLGKGLDGETLPSDFDTGVRVAVDTYDHDIRNSLTGPMMRLQLGIAQGGLSASEAQRILEALSSTEKVLSAISATVNAGGYNLTRRGPYLVIDIGVQPNELVEYRSAKNRRDSLRQQGTP